MQSKTHKLTITAMLSAAAAVLMFLDFSVPFLIPSFVKMDVSELPALLAAFSLGPVYGVVVCLVKNLIHLTCTSTGGVGELCNFLLGAVFVFVAGIIYKRRGPADPDKEVRKRLGRRKALLGAVVGAAAMALFSVPLNYYLTYPIYTAFMPLDGIIAMYQLIIPSVKSLFSCLVIFNMPFTFLKGMLDVLITFLIYKPLSPILHR